MINPVSSSLSPLAAATQPKASAPPPKPNPPQDTVQLSQAAQKAASGGDADHDGDSH